MVEGHSALVDLLAAIEAQGHSVRANSRVKLGPPVLLNGGDANGFAEISKRWCDIERAILVVGAVRGVAATAGTVRARAAGSNGRQAGGAPSEILGKTACIEQVRKEVLVAAVSDLNVLITGETGTGKGLVARAIHRLSGRCAKPLVTHNCARARLFESRLFGHCSGAFTGATDQEGFLVEANGSYLFLDEVEDLSVENQAKLLRVIEDGAVRPIGSKHVQQVSVRFIAATNRDPDLLVKEGRLREDFLHRVQELEIHVPPLRDRLEDIPALVEHFLRDGDGPTQIAPDSLDALMSHSWPGNVRELRSVVRVAKAYARADHAWTITPAHLRIRPARSRPAITPRTDGTLREILEECEERAVNDALRQAGGSRSEAARLLGIERRSLRRKIERFGIDPSQSN